MVIPYNAEKNNILLPSTQRLKILPHVATGLFSFIVYLTCEFQLFASVGNCDHYRQTA